MKTILICCFLAVLNIQVESYTWRFDNNSKLFRIKEEGEQCKKAGEIICNGCEESLKCISIGDDYLVTPLETCSSGSTCSAGEGCINRYTEQCPAPQQKGEFPCSTTGMYPDPFDCKKYHFCPPDEKNPKKPIEYSITATCDKGYGYSAMDTFCSDTLDDDKCGSSDIKCTDIGNTDTYSVGSSYFYICKKRKDNQELYPHLYRCPHGETYGDGGCYASKNDNDKLSETMSGKPESIPGFPEYVIPDKSESVPANSDLTTESTSIHGEITGNGKGFQCISTGKFAHPENCRKFVLCQKVDGEPIEQDCKRGKYYDAKFGKCVPGSC